MTIMTTGEPSMMDVVSVSVRLKSERSWVVEGVDFTESTVERVKLFRQRVLRLSDAITCMLVSWGFKIISFVCKVH